MKIFGTLLVVSVLVTSSCVSKKEYAALEEEARSQTTQLQGSLNDCQEELLASRNQVNGTNSDLAQCNTQLEAERNKVEVLEEQNLFLKENNTNLLARLSDLSIVSKTGAESIKASLETLNRQNAYIQDLNSSIQRKDSLNLALVMKLKRSLANVNDTDVRVEVKKGVVYISLSDKLLFRSGSDVITERAEEVLEKIASVVNDHNDFDILVEGHTDDVPISNECIEDNWDLSVNRAVSVVRSLQENYNVSPERLTAGGRSKYLPKADNETSDGRSQNRRTEIILLPKLDQFFELLSEPLPGEAGQ